MVERGMVIVGAGECGARAAFALIGLERHLPYERPPPSKGGMAVERPGMKLIAERVCFERHGIRQVLANEARAIDRAGRTVDLADGEHVDYRRLVAASGIGPGNAVARSGSPR